MDLIHLNRLMRQAVRPIRGVELGIEQDRLRFSVFSAIPWFKVRPTPRTVRDKDGDSTQEPAELYIAPIYEHTQVTHAGHDAAAVSLSFSVAEVPGMGSAKLQVYCARPLHDAATLQLRLPCHAGPAVYLELQ
jgi:hypothetical protein